MFQLRSNETAHLRGEPANLPSRVNIQEKVGVAIDPLGLSRWRSAVVARHAVSCIRNVGRRLGWSLLPTALLVSLAGCSGKPGASDIERALVTAYDCPLLDIRDVKKLNGVPGPQGTYDVAFSYVVAVKGDESTAVKTLTEATFAFAEFEAVQEAVRHQQNLQPLGKEADPGDPLLAYQQEVQKRSAELNPCASMESASIWDIQIELAKRTMLAKTNPAVFQIGSNIARTGRMAKTEQGWAFEQLTPTFDDVQALMSHPAPVVWPASKLAGILAQGAAPASTADERTLVGTIRDGKTDSCLEVSVGGADKCYRLPSEPVQALRIFDICKGGDLCAITGQFDDKAESLGTFSKVEKAAR